MAKRTATTLNGHVTRAAFDAAAALAGCARGDHHALRALYDLEAPRMLGVALRILKRRALAEEAVHDAFLRIWNNAGRYEPARAEARTWIYTILRNGALNILRGEARVDLTAEIETFERESIEETPEDIMLKLSDADALRRCLDRLEPGRRRIVIMAYAQGLSHGELAALLDIPLGTIKSWLRRSLLSLRECLQ